MKKSTKTALKWGVGLGVAYVGGSLLLMGGNPITFLFTAGRELGSKLLSGGFKRAQYQAPGAPLAYSIDPRTGQPVPTYQ